MTPLPVIVVLDNIRSLYNTGAFFRTADACAVQKLVLCGITPRPDQGGRQARAIAKTALGAEQSVTWAYEPDTHAALANARQAGYQIAVIETSAEAVSLFDWAPSWPVCLVFGHETDGVGTSIARDHVMHVRIPMFGAKTSLNVATAGGVVLYELRRKHLQLSARLPRRQRPAGHFVPVPAVEASTAVILSERGTGVHLAEVTVMTVNELMTLDPVCCTPQTPLREVARLMSAHDCGEIPVVETRDNRLLLGVVTDRDIVLRAVADGRNPADTPIESCMTKNVVTVRPDTSLDDCRKLMEEHQIRRVPVVDGSGACCGIVSQADVAQRASAGETGELVREVSKPGVKTH